MNLPIVALIPWWEDEELLKGAIASVTEDVEEVITLEGPYADVLEERPLVARSDETIWTSEAEKRNALLVKARQYACPAWALMLDSDERAYNLDALRAFWRAAPSVESSVKLSWPIPYLTYEAQDMNRPLMIQARFKLLRYDETTRYLQHGYLVSHRGETYDLSTDTEGRPIDPSTIYRCPMIVHRPDLRDPERRFLGTRRESADKRTS